jgi:transcriptional regulator with XRE-family HTH domain
MYNLLLKDWKLLFPEFPREVSLDLGLAIKQIRLRMGLTQDELARNSQLKPAALKTLENGYSKFTKTSNIEVLARALHTNLREIVLEAREWFPANFFVLKLMQTEPNIMRRRKHREEISYKRKSLSYSGFQVDFLSPPISGGSHFSSMLVEIVGGKKIEGLKLEYPNEVSGFVQRGTVKLIYDSKQEIDLFGNQSFSLRGDKIHHLLNMDNDNPARLFLVFNNKRSHNLEDRTKKKKIPTDFSVGRAINKIRQLYSDSESRPLSFSELSYLTGLDVMSLRYLESTTGAKQVVYWDKIEKITQSLNMSLSRFVDLAEDKDEGYVHIATAHDRALIDYRHYLGVRLKSALLPRTGGTFHMSEVYVEPKGGIRRASWKRTDGAMLSVYVEDGELLVEVGKNRKTIVSTGESCYFDGSLGYIFTNRADKPLKLVISTSPPIIF